MKSKFLTIFFCIAINYLNAQQNTLSSGNTISGSGGSASYSVGQIADDFLSEGIVSVNEGLQQPIELITLSLLDFQTTSITAIPNPTTDFITLTVENSFDGNFVLHDIQGKRIQDKKINEIQNLIDFRNLSSGMYLLNVYSNSVLKKQFKIIKKD